MYKILMVEDDSTIRRGVCTWLGHENFETDEAENAQVAIEKLTDNNYDLVILDVMLPVKNGIEVLKYIRSNRMEKEWLPVIMLTAKSEEDDKILGLTLGADDYVTKPFSNRELLARIKANLRKRSSFQNEVMNSISLPFEIDYTTYTLRVNSESIEMSKKELMLVQYFSKHINEYISKEELLREVWNYENIDATRTVDIHVSKLRKKFEKVGLKDLIVTKHGVGYGMMEQS